MEIDLRSASRATVSREFLSDTVDGTRRSKFQAIVMPSEAPAGLSTPELDAIADVEREFGIRQVDSYVYPGASVGLAVPTYSGSLDGLSASITAGARSGPFSDLRGSVEFEDIDPGLIESYGYIALPADDLPTGSTFTPMVTMSVPGSDIDGSLIGVFRSDDRERLVITASMNGFQSHFAALSAGIIEWVTKGVHLGSKRNYFSVHVDDVFMEDARWSTEAKCTPTDGDCEDPSVSTTTIRMNAADAAYLRQWQGTHGMMLDLVFNGVGNDDHVRANGSDPMGDDLIANQGSYRWISHTWGHEYLGCVQLFEVIPWLCREDDGSIAWVSEAMIESQIADNIDWATSKGIVIDRSELVTGEHSGMRHTPQEPSDNPFFDPVLARLGIRSVGSDASREHRQRSLGASGALTLPRYPMNLYYNVGTAPELVDEYNWIYTTRADGGSGVCETDPNSTCIDPLDLDTGFSGYILPLEARMTLTRILNGLPYAHYAHQSNLTEDRLLYRVLDEVLADYRSLYSDQTPLINLTMAESTTQLAKVQGWQDYVEANGTSIDAYIVADRVHIGSTTAREVPLTVPAGSNVDGSPFGTSYSGRLSGWTGISAGGSLSVKLPGSW